MARLLTSGARTLVGLGALVLAAFLVDLTDRTTRLARGGLRGRFGMRIVLGDHAEHEQGRADNEQHGRHSSSPAGVDHPIVTSITVLHRVRVVPVAR
ncbi:MAG: hypothetical protein ABWZ76_00860 [Acidimicrobiales bacterium]